MVFRHSWQFYPHAIYNLHVGSDLGIGLNKCSHTQKLFSNKLICCIHNTHVFLKRKPDNPQEETQNRVQCVVNLYHMRRQVQILLHTIEGKIPCHDNYNNLLCKPHVQEPTNQFWMHHQWDRRTRPKTFSMGFFFVSLRLALGIPWDSYVSQPLLTESAL